VPACSHAAHAPRCTPFLLSPFLRALRDEVYTHAYTHTCFLAHSKFVAPVNKFLSFGTDLQTGTNRGEISQAGMLRKEMLRKKDGLPAEMNSANIGKEGVENPLGPVGSHTSFISGESFLHDSRHGEQFPFPSHAARDHNSTHGLASMKDGAGGGSTAPWEAKQQERWKQHARSREQIRAAVDASTPALARAAQSASSIVLRDGDTSSRKGPRGSSPGGGNLRSTLRGSLTGSPDSRKSISWEDPKDEMTRSTIWEDARRARDAQQLLQMKRPQEGKARGISVPQSEFHRDERPGSASRNESMGAKMTEEKFRIKSLDRVAELRQQQQGFEVQGPR
jgi:hypothetical protein